MLVSIIDDFIFNYNIVILTTDFQKITDACKKKAVDGHFLQMSRISISNCVLVTGIASDTGHDTLMFYFENERRSAGSEVEKIEYNKEEGTCFVYFEDYKGLLLLLT